LPWCLGLGLVCWIEVEFVTTTSIMVVAVDCRLCRLSVDAKTKRFAGFKIRRTKRFGRSDDDVDDTSVSATMDLWIFYRQLLPDGQTQQVHSPSTDSLPPFIHFPAFFISSSTSKSKEEMQPKNQCRRRATVLMDHPGMMHDL